MKSLPILAVTMGDPSGIGPEIALKALSRREVYEKCRPLLVGDAAALRRARAWVGLPELQIHPIDAPSEAAFRAGCVDLLQVPVGAGAWATGELSAAAGEIGFRCVETAIRLAQAGEVDATVTNPINKQALNLAGHHYSGHTEIYADLTGTKDYTMLLAHDNLRVVHVSTHVSLREACERVKKDRVLKVIEIAHRACVELGIDGPRVGVAGLNPHSGENGLFGSEEREQIMPAIQAARALGIDADGPVPPDTIFSKALGGWYDIVVAMYHDQGHIPLKLLGFRYDREAGRWESVAGVNITLGLPIIRTSVDHGTAFDLAGTGRASEISLLNAIDYAVALALNKTKRQKPGRPPDCVSGDGPFDDKGNLWP